jgi:uncharacterized protein YecE (DUF72 family)
MANLYSGTSGYSYAEWKGAFYPEKLAQTKFLDYYSSRFSTVEINNTFYRFPSEKMLTSWTDTTPEGFTFAVKCNQRVTHHSRLNDVGEITHDFVERCHALGDKLGPILFQLPPNLKRDDDVLRDFVGVLPPGARYAVEFRHASWFEDATFQCLADASVALCVSEGEKLDTPRRATGAFCYVRLRKDAYTDEELADWRNWIDEQLAANLDVFVYLKHDKSGASPEQALKLLDSGTS